MNTANTILSVNDLEISFKLNDGVFTAVNKISFNIEKSKTLAIVGESGSGKSLTALAIMDLLPANAGLRGSIEIKAGNAAHTLNEPNNKAWQQLRGKAIGMIFQEPISSLNPVMTIGKQISESIKTHQQATAQQARNIALSWLQKVQLSEVLYSRYPHQLSGGQKQRAMIAMALCNHPALLIADEPTTALDVTVQKEVIQLMQTLQHETGTAMIFITHDLALASEIADEVLVMYKGEIVETGPTEKVLHAPEHPYTKALIECRPTLEKKGKRLPVIADFLSGNLLVDDKADVADKNLNEVLLGINNLRVWFTEKEHWLGKPVSYFKAVDNVSFSLYKGEVLGLVGESGCGKSTLSRSLMGLLPISSGQVIYKGVDLATLPQKDWTKVRKQVQMIFQDPFASLNPRMTIGEMLMEPMQVHHIVPQAKLKTEALRLLNLVQLPSDVFNRYPHQFSGGQRQRVGIARALALRPELLICDESLSALDVSVQAQILNLLKELKEDFQLTYLFISHDLSVVHYISDRVMVMQSGQIVEMGDARQVMTHPMHGYTQKLLDAVPKI